MWITFPFTSNLNIFLLLFDICQGINFSWWIHLCLLKRIHTHYMSRPKWVGLFISFVVYGAWYLLPVDLLLSVDKIFWLLMHIISIVSEILNCYLMHGICWSFVTDILNSCSIMWTAILVGLLTRKIVKWRPEGFSWIVYACCWDV